jgi:hypothetical protein
MANLRQNKLKVNRLANRQSDFIRITLPAESKGFRRSSNQIALAISQAINFPLILAQIPHSFPLISASSG